MLADGSASADFWMACTVSLAPPGGLCHCPTDWLGDGYCDTGLYDCDSSACGVDGGDCLASPPAAPMASCTCKGTWQVYVGSTLHSGVGCDNPDADPNGRWCETATSPNDCYDTGASQVQDLWFYCGDVAAAPPPPACACAVAQLGNGVCDFLCNNAVCEHDRGDCSAEPPLLLSTSPSPPPPAPPFPPLGAGAQLEETVSTVVTFASPGTVEAFDAATVRTNMAAIAGVEASAVTVHVVAGSVLVTVTVAAPNATASAAIESKVSQGMATPEAATAALGVAVWTAPSVQTVTTKVVLYIPTSPPPLAPPPKTGSGSGNMAPIIIGCVVGVLLLTIVVAMSVYCACCRKRKKMVPASVDL